MTHAPPAMLQHVVEASARRVPDQIAVVDRERSMSYAALDAEAAHVAQMLRDHGIVAGDRVGIWLDKSIEALVAIIAVLKAGAAYVPLDPQAPVHRIVLMINDCGMSGLVTSPQRRAQIRAASGDDNVVCVVLVDGDGWIAEWSRTDDVRGATTAEPIAYLLYTSGSTGTPKGVVISHQAALAFVEWAARFFELGVDDRVASHAPWHFDLAIFDLFATMQAGATIVIVPAPTLIFPRMLADFIDRARITTWYSVPSALTRLVLHGHLDRYRFPHLRQILFAGEVFPPAYLRQLQTLIPQAAYYNLYGPTETNVCTVFRVGVLAPNDDAPIPIGQACCGDDVFALNERGQPVAPDETGELYVAGPTLMSGYWGQSEKTRAVLIADPRDPSSQHAVVRTGDLVRQDQQGNFIFLGRRDAMVKSRGYRIELGEIEATLYRHPAVEEAAVFAVPDDVVGNLLVAMVRLRDGTNATSADLVRFCADYLPAYMLPTSLVIVVSLPRTSTGKVDRATLAKEYRSHGSTA